MLRNMKISVLLIIAAAVVISSLIAIIGYKDFIDKEIHDNKNIGENQIKRHPDFSCIENITENKVRGDSMSGLIENDEVVQLLHGFYDCNEIKRNEVVAFKYAGNDVPLIKVTKAIPGDNFYLKEASNNRWNIIINDEIAKNSKNQTYVINGAGHRMLNMYVKDYNQTIPENTYLVLGNLAKGTLDSSRFGLIHKSNVIARVVKKQK